MSNAAKALDRYLAMWEDMLFSFDLYRHAGLGFPQLPEIQNSYKFREFLLRSYQMKSPDEAKHFDVRNIYGRKEYPSLHRMISGSHLRPFEILSWTLSSRRVFRLTAQMQRAFEHISLANVTIGEIDFPFDSFVIELAEPIKDEGKSNDQVSYETSHILVSRPFRYTEEIVQKAPKYDAQRAEPSYFTCIPSSCVEYAPFSSDQKRSMLDHMRKNRNGKIISFLDRKVSKKLHGLHRYDSSSMIFTRDKDVPVLDILKATEQPGFEHELRMIRIIINLCLYLEALPKTELLQEATDQSWRTERIKLDKRTNLITDTTEVCHIGGFHLLKALDSTESLGLEGSSLTEPYWRRRHRRRKPGEGQNPDAPRSVKVKPSLVGAYLIPETGGLPKGSVSSVE